ncbi:15840_t:CDS:2 [Acaulospora morrowiae]|uniref:15840_t:CDS:1 n=1 Tax=Acaulospora morrowiae TaxID=94023 RepID=A0A9N9F7I4_9GLOM|nr:15840_t:CDS:2 [Acaulospora morrowiae]
MINDFLNPIKEKEIEEPVDEEMIIKLVQEEDDTNQSEEEEDINESSVISITEGLEALEKSPSEGEERMINTRPE